MKIGKPHVTDHRDDILRQRMSQPSSLPLGDTSLSFLQRVYRSVTQPMSRRMQAAMAARPHEHPKLGAVATVSMSGDDYAAMLDRAIERSRAGAPDFRLIQHAPARAPGDGEPQC